MKTSELTGRALDRAAIDEGQHWHDDPPQRQ